MRLHVIHETLASPHCLAVGVLDRSLTEFAVWPVETRPVGTDGGVESAHGVVETVTGADCAEWLPAAS